MDLWRCEPDPSGDERFWATEPGMALSFGEPDAVLIRGKLDLEVVRLVRPDDRLYRADSPAQRERLRVAGADWVKYSTQWGTNVYTESGAPDGPYLLRPGLTSRDTLSFGVEVHGWLWWPVVARGECFAWLTKRGRAAVVEAARWTLPAEPFTFDPAGGGVEIC
ncbi:MAG: hypothetical protein OXE76_11560 [Alphaproteobacteria bacterium]|nr:hypothetical protein [Alphaproteobacteria bacterium]